MAANNTAEATLRSRYEDGISKGVDQTRELIEKSFNTLKSGTEVFGSAIEAVFSHATAGLEGWRTQLSQKADETESFFKRMSFAAVAFGLAAAEAFLHAGKAAGEWILETVKEASAAFEARTAFEALTAAAGIQADVFQKKLKVATEGQVSGLTLLRNANKFMQSEIPLTSEQYVTLTENVFRLAKASGVDAPTALDTMSNALIRGNARGFQAIGIHINLKDAVTQAMEATGQHANVIADATKLQAFYADLIAKTTDAVDRLGAKHLTVEDVILQSERTYKGYITTLGVSILRSGVLQELLEQTKNSLLGVSLAGDQQNAIALKTNETLIKTVQIISFLLDAITNFGALWATIWAGASGLFFAFGNVVFGVGAGIIYFLERILVIAGSIPGVIGRSAAEGAVALAKVAAQFEAIAKKADAGFQGSFDGFGSGIIKLEQMSQSAKKLTEELQKVSGEVVHGEAGQRGLAETTQKAAGAQKELNDQLEKYHQLLLGIQDRSLDPAGKLLSRLRDDLVAQQQLTLISDDQRNKLRLAAYQSYFTSLDEMRAADAAKELAEAEKELDGITKMITQGLQSAAKVDIIDQLLGGPQRRAEEIFNKIIEDGRKKREESQRKEISEALSAASAIENAMKLATSVKGNQSIGLDALAAIPRTIDTLKTKLAELRSQKIITDQQVAEVQRLQIAIEKLNHININPFRDMLEAAKAEIKGFTEQGASAFATFFSNIVTSQDDAGKKFLAAFVGMIGQMLVHLGTVLVQSGVAEILLAQTLVGRLMGASTAAGVAAVAFGAVMIAAGGALQGAASLLTQSNAASASSGGSSVQPSQASSNPTQVINVGRPYGQQGQSADSQQSTVKIVLTPIPGYTAKVMKQDIGYNGAARVAVVNA